MAIATITTVTTLSITHYLLARPWCIHLDATGHQTIEYGQNDCKRESRMANNLVLPPVIATNRSLR